jgi:hypothetical protein
MQNAHYEHEDSVDSVYRIFRTALARKKFGDNAKIVADIIISNECNNEDYDWSEFISFCNLDEAKMFWGLVSEELHKNKD